MILGIPVVDGHDLTRVMLDQLAKSVAEPENFTAVIVDNASEKPYIEADYTHYPFDVHVIREPENIGYYTPLMYLRALYDDHYIGLAHNDLLIYTPGWDLQMRQYFEQDPQLGLVGLCGSNEIDERGGRGGGTMCNFVGREIPVAGKIWKGQDASAGLHIYELKAACVLDSLFMMFRSIAIDTLVKPDRDGKWEDLTLAHFYDRIWPCRTLEAGYRVAIAPIDCDHIGGMTTTANVRYRDDCIRWLNERKIPYENPETEMYLVAERRFLGEYRDEKKFLPCYVYPNYNLEHRA